MAPSPRVPRQRPARRRPSPRPPEEAPVRKVLNWLFRRVIGKLAAIPVRRRLNAFERATHQPQAVQEELLRRILAEHADTAFGRDHHFAACRVAADFRNNVPVAGYEYVEPYVKRVVAGEWQALLSSPKI